jgi:hypothetical protein
MIKNISGLDILKVILGFFFIAIGLFYVIYPQTISVFPQNVIRLLGLIFLLRGVFRVYQVIRLNLKNEA